MEKFWLISVSMGYGHQRTAFSLADFAVGKKPINANDYPGSPEKDRKIWLTSQHFYEGISNVYRLPLIGKLIFKVFDQFQKILSFYPKRDLSKPNFTLKQIYSLLKKGWGRHLIERCKKENPRLPLVTTFFTPAFMAEHFGWPQDIFCVVCDADIARTWAPLNPQKSKIKYFAPTERVVERLKLYGVNPENIFLTGYPLPIENIGKEEMEILKKDLRYRLLNLDPQKRYFKKYKILIESSLGKLPSKPDHPLTILFSVGGAGAQKEIGIKIAQVLAPKIKKGEVKLILSAGVKEKVKNYFEKRLQKLNLLSKNGPMYRYIGLIEILYGKDIEDYFEKFNKALRKTDILWTKPSELSFYSALGIPIIISPPIGSQEEFNMRWLLKSGFGIYQEKLNHVDQWLFDWLNNGYLAEMAMEAFIEGKKLGVFNINKIIEKCSGS